MPDQAQEITFLVAGQSGSAGQPARRGRVAEPSTELKGTIKAAVRVGAQRGPGEMVRIAARPGEDVMVLHIANGPTLYLHPEHARDLMRAQVGAAQTTQRGIVEPALDREVTIPAKLSWRGLDEVGATRAAAPAGIGEVWIDGVEVVTRHFTDKVARMLAAAVTKKLDGQVDPGVYQLSPEELPRLKDSGRKLASVPAPPGGGPILVLAHGTFVDTASTFGKLWSLHPTRVGALFQRYAGCVYALDHPTVGVSPFANALTLAETLPKGARLHLVTHSRGGLVAEALARVAGGQGLRREDLDLFDGDTYGQHRVDLGKLDKIAKQQSFRVERMVRVACPARGTLLASRRLDAYLSVLKWGLELAGVPVIPELVDFLGEVARRRADPAELPGLEAMMPGRPFANWLNVSADAVSGDLRVVAGDLQGDSIRSWIKALLSDAFYWTDNDLVVQTRSMYGGTPRSGAAASFLLDRGGTVTHFNYFANERTVEAIAAGLLQEQPDGFRPIGPLSWAGEDASGTRAALAARRSRSGKANERPAVFMLPDILGSHLKVDGERVWLSLRLRNDLDQLKWDPDEASRVQPDGLVGMVYDDLLDHLAETHEVIPFSFDWRRPIEDEAHRLADAVEAALTARNAAQQPVRIVAHGMGGLLVRAMQLERPESWKRMMLREGARVLMLGTPNGGSWTPMQVLSGDDTFGNVLTASGSLFDGYRARQTFAGMSGLLQLQAGLAEAPLGLATTAGWQRLADADYEGVQRRVKQGTWWHNQPLQLEAYKWGLPPQPVLDQAVELRKRLDAQRAALASDAAKLLLVVGTAPSTPAGVRLTEAGVAYEAVSGGDGRVTLKDAGLPGVRTWKTNVPHGDLANAKEAFAAYVELLTRGETDKLTKLLDVTVHNAAEATAAPAPTLSRPARSMRDAEPPVLHRDVITAELERSAAAAPRGPGLRISVVNGNLKFIREPLMLGHYHALELSGSEAEMDRLLRGAMSASLKAGLYSSAPGTHQIFVNTHSNPDDPYMLPRPEAVIVLGLGEEGTLRVTDLCMTVRQAALAYAQRISETMAPATFDLSATLIGTGGIGVETGTAAQAIARGVAEANERLAANDWPVVGNLKLIELYLDRASEAHQALRALAADYPRRYVLVPYIENGLGALPRPAESGYRGTGYDFISVEHRPDTRGAVIEFTLDTRRARNEVRGQATQPQLIDELVRAGANDENRNTQIGRSLFNLLVPVELEPFLSGSLSVLLQLDRATAAYPWEMLDTRRDDDPRPWAVRTRMLRKLRTGQFRDRPSDAQRQAAALVIGEPVTNSDEYPPLPGASEEARAVADVLGKHAALMLKPDALTVINAAYDRPYRLIHIAGHGDLSAGGTGGVVLSNNTVFGPHEVESMRTVPELAFINCCYLGKIEAGTVQLGTRRRRGSLTQFAAGVAEQLINIGVRCVVAAGWAVDDLPAKLFATQFYGALIEGRTFAEAVGFAREAAYQNHPDSNTWAAYQCYGDPNWRYVADGEVGQKTPPNLPPVVSSADLELELNTLLMAGTYGPKTRDEVRAQLEQLEAAYGERWGNQGAVAEAFGAAYGEVGDFKNGVRWYSRAVSAEDGCASLKAAEQLANLRARHGATLENKAKAKSEILIAIGELERLLAASATSERASLLAAAFKRLAMVERKGGRRAAFRTAVQAMARRYGEAEKLARKNKADNLHYPISNRMAAKLVLSFDQRDRSGLDPGDITELRQAVKKNEADADFWLVVAAIELRMFEALAERNLAKELDGILEALSNVHSRASATRMWGSVHDQADFVLSPYIATSTVTAAERDAARTLLARLQDYAAT